MAKTKTTKKTKVAQKETLKATAILRKGVLAYVGLHGAAFEAAQTRFTQLRGTTDNLFDTLVEKGTEIEAKASVFAKEAQTKATETYSDTTAKVRGVLPKASNDRVEELEAEVAKLNKKISAMSKKAAKPARKVAMKTEKTVKAAPVAPAAQKAA